MDRAEGWSIKMAALECFAFYDTAKTSLAIVRTSDPGPYGCFIFAKGVI
ncbi:RbsD/FucU domain-containing protein [Rhizobium rhizogenes]|nr:RbsD/FucU domain-containing protein [Rhizobium rhizogenes]